jgi:hypothetical protein
MLSRSTGRLPANIGRLRRRLLAVPAIAAAEITPIERT